MSQFVTLPYYRHLRRKRQVAPCCRISTLSVTSFKTVNLPKNRNISYRVSTACTSESVARKLPVPTTRGRLTNNIKNTPSDIPTIPHTGRLSETYTRLYR